MSAREGAWRTPRGPPMNRTLVDALVVLLLILISGVFVAAEMSLVSLRDSQIKQMAHHGPPRQGRRPAEREPEPLPVRRADRRDPHRLPQRGLRRRHARGRGLAAAVRVVRLERAGLLDGRADRHHRAHRLRLDRARGADGQAARAAAHRGVRDGARARSSTSWPGCSGRSSGCSASRRTSWSSCSAATPGRAARRSATRRSGRWSAGRAPSARRSAGSWTTSSTPASGACAR